MKIDTEDRLFTANGIGWMVLLFHPVVGEWFIFRNCRTLCEFEEQDTAKRWLIGLLIYAGAMCFIPYPWWIFCHAVCHAGWFFFAWIPHRELLKRQGAGCRRRSFFCLDTLFAVVAFIILAGAGMFVDSLFAPAVLDTSDPEAVMESLEAIGEELKCDGDKLSREAVDFLIAMEIVRKRKLEIGDFDGMSAEEISKSVRRKYPEEFAHMRAEWRKAMVLVRSFRNLRQSR